MARRTRSVGTKKAGSYGEVAALELAVSGSLTVINS